MSYRAPVEEYLFLLQNVVGFGKVSATDRFKDVTDDVVAAILTEAGKLSEEVLAPLQRSGDLHPARLENGIVRTSPGFGDGYKAVAEGGWIAISASPDYGGMGLPITVTTAVNEMMSSGCVSLQLAPLMSQGQIEALEHHASDALKDIYLPKLVSGEWTGTMNLTESHAGSDVGALSARAEPNGDGTYAVTGQKVFISWGDHDVAENICHLVLARLPDAGPGTKGISLFLVPKRLPDSEGNAGVANSLKVVSLEHKLGLHGSPTAVMQFDGATGWLIGAENNGLAAMFTMMNNARLGVGGQGIGVAEAAYQHALEYALERKQGQRANGENGTIIDHADVRRMLLSMKADIFAARSIALACGVALDSSVATGDRDWAARAAFLTPIAKAFGTYTGMAVADLGIQVHGGMGYIEETGASQYARDVRVTAIYEGTNGIQAMDLVARKMKDGGEMASRLLDEVEDFAERARSEFPELAEAVWQATESLRESTDWLNAQSDPDERFAGAVPYLRAFARVLGGHFHLVAAMADKGGTREKLARFYILKLLPEHAGLLAQVQSGASSLFEFKAEEFQA